jgi:hypothetical protein
MQPAEQAAMMASATGKLEELFDGDRHEAANLSREYVGSFPQYGLMREL